MKNLLIIEPDKNLRKLYKTELEMEGFRVDTATFAGEGLCDVECGDYDLVIMEMRLPDMEGIATLHHLAARNGSTPVIINSASPACKDNFNSWAAADFVLKSSDLAELKKKVRATLNVHDCYI